MERNTDTLYILRFIAAIMVVWYHFGSPTFFSYNGGEAVNFFFFISGFVMIVANARYFKSENTEFARKEFYVKRFARIYPLYFLALLAQAIFHYCIKTIDTPTVKYRLIFEVLGIERWLYVGAFNAPGWTISCEFFFYLFFPFLIVYMRKNEARFKTVAWVYFIFTYCLTLVLSYLTELHLPTIPKLVVTGLRLNPVFLISIFMLGMLCGKVFLDRKARFFRNQINSLITVILCIAIVFLVKFYVPGYYVLANGLLSPVYFVMILAITSFKKKDTTFFSAKPLIFLGDISYSIYIFQAPFMNYFKMFVMPIGTWPALIVATLALIAFCSVLYFTVEMPCKNLILNLFNKKRAPKEPDFAVL
ncbi:acyltransferase family protein [Mucilaginibacter endophyticus]|uniref:acyltransferase family protein n=1 Tax=Mucilaginibacter endophyticus TaxID=2675003 RepID=UPI000E0CEFAD|nr:acyltransferase [Mucilaginibacter endophyticus]